MPPIPWLWSLAPSHLAPPPRHSCFYSVFDSCFAMQDPWCVPARADQIQRYYPAATRTDINSGHCERSAGLVEGKHRLRTTRKAWLRSRHYFHPTHVTVPRPKPGAAHARSCAGPHDDTPDLVNERLLQWLSSLEAKVASA